MSRCVSCGWAAALALALSSANAAPERIPQPRYVIFMMGDGMGVDELELARQYSLAVLGHDLFMTGALAHQGACALVDTYSSSDLVTDSAAAASAWATGWKIRNGEVAVDPSSREPLQTILEFYKEKHGFRTGIITNDEIAGASPAAFAAHIAYRMDLGEIARQYCDQSQPDVILGGGRKDFLPNRRWDGRDLVGDFVVRHGYRYVETAEELARVRSGKVLGLFADGLLTWQIDRPPEGAKEPMVTEMVEAGLRILSADRPKGFFLFAEECMADKAGHKTDAAAMVMGILELDRAVAAAYRFYQKHRGETLLIVTADHETGGLQWVLGYDWEEKVRAADRRAGERSPVARLASVHASIAQTVKGLDEQLTPEQRAMLRWRYRQFQFAPELERALDEGRRSLGKLGQKWDSVLTYLVARNTGAYYSGTAHSLAPVPLFAVGVGAERFNGHLDNTDVGRTLFRLAGRQDFRNVRPAGPETYVSRPPRATPRSTPRPTASRSRTSGAAYGGYALENADEDSRLSTPSKRMTSSRSRTSDAQNEDD